MAPYRGTGVGWGWGLGSEAGVGLFKVKKPLEQRQDLWNLGTWGPGDGGFQRSSREESSLGGFGVGGLQFLV